MISSVNGLELLRVSPNRRPKVNSVRQPESSIRILRFGIPLVEHSLAKLACFLFGQCTHCQRYHTTESSLRLYASSSSDRTQEHTHTHTLAAHSAPTLDSWSRSSLLLPDSCLFGVRYCAARHYGAQVCLPCRHWHTTSSHRNSDLDSWPDQIHRQVKRSWNIWNGNIDIHIQQQERTGHREAVTDCTMEPMMSLLKNT